MDRSFLSQPEVIAASRSFVCIRVPSYEDKAEMKFCRDLMVGKSGEVENTTFAILSPDGKTTLTRPVRGLKRLYSGPADMAKAMDRVAARYKARAKCKALPSAADVRLGMAIAAGDGLPLAVVVSPKPTDLEETLAELAWRDEFVGRFTFAVAASAAECKNIEGATEGVLFVEPDTFGRKGTIVRRVESASPERLAEAMRATLAQHQTSTKNMREHQRKGIENGVFYTPMLPVTDPEEAGARQRTKRAIERRKE